MQEEIFGPILPVVTYDRLDDAIAYVNARPRPLALYLFGNDAESQRRVLERTTSGSVLVNDTILQYAQDDLPVRRRRAKRHGRLPRRRGFQDHEPRQGRVPQARFNLADLFRPPFGRVYDFLLSVMLR